MNVCKDLIKSVVKNSECDGIVVGTSGGIDSSVAMALCCRAIGADKVLAISLPTSVNNPQDVKDVRELCGVYGVKHRVVNIGSIISAFKSTLNFTSPQLSGNLMARARMTVLYYYANLNNYLVCGTSNRSEYMIGYCTKWGDNVADFEPIVHLYKTEVYAMARELKIPESIIMKAPSAGLWEGQSDEREIGMGYDKIDETLKLLENSEWVPSTLEEKMVVRMVERSEHKRGRVPQVKTQIKTLL